MPLVIGGRYGLSSKDFSPAMAKAVFDELTQAAPRNSFTVGINDDVSHTSLTPDPAFRVEPQDVVAAVFYGLGADGTVGANKNSVKIIAEDAGLYAQGYFVYDFAQVRRADRVASALRAAADPGAVPDPAGQLRRRAPVPVRRALRHAAPGRARRHAAAERAVRAGRGVGPPAARDAAADHRPQAAVLRHRRLRRGGGRGAARARQHRAADLLLRAVQGAAARRGDRAYQARDPQDLREARRGRGAAQFRRGRCGAGEPVRGARAGGADQQLGASADRARARAGLRARGHRDDAGRPRRRNPGQRHAGRRHLAVRHRRSGRSATSPTRCRPGTRTCASNAASAASSARMA